MGLALDLPRILERKTPRFPAVNPHLDLVVRLFVRKDKRDRIVSLASNPKRRADLRDALLHDTRSLARETMQPLSRDLDASGVARALAAVANGKHAYCISDAIDPKGDLLDDREEDLATALLLVVGKERDALLFVLAPNARKHAAYYENHEGERFLLVANALPPPAP
jgi:hypothetical protein